MYKFLIQIIYCTLIVLLLASNAYAQHKLTGFVKDSTGNSIEFANVLLKAIDQDSDNIIGSITDSTGYFILNAPIGSYQLVISFIGYETFTKEVKLTKSLDLGIIPINKSSKALEIVEITTSKPFIKRDIDKLLFNVADSPLKSGFDGIEVLKRTPLIYIDGSENILLRNERATVLINGKKLNLSGSELTNYIKSLDSKSIKQIEIQEVASAESDADVQGGIINFIVDRRETGFSMSLKNYYTQRGSHPGYTNSTSLNYGGKKWNMYSNLYYTRKDNNGNSINDIEFNQIERRYEETRDFVEDFQYLSVITGATFELFDKHDLGFEFFGSLDDYFVTGESLLDVYTDNEFSNRVETKSNRASNPKYYNLALNYSIKLDSLGSSLRAMGDYAVQRLDNNFDVHSIFANDGVSDLINQGNTDAITNIVSAQLDYNKKMKMFDLMTGVKFTSTDRNNESTFENFVDDTFVLDTTQSSFFDFTEQIYAGYVSIAKKLKHDFSVKVGLRAENTILNGVNLFTQEKVEQNYFNLFPSVFLSKQLKNKHHMSFNYSYRINRPSFAILNPTNTRTNAFNLYVGNPNIEPEYRNNFLFSYEFENNQAIGAYCYLVTNKILGTFSLLDDEVTVHAYQNSGFSRKIGIDYSFTKNVKEWWYLKFQTSLYNSFYDLVDGNFQGNTFTASINNDWTLPKNWLAQLDVAYNSPNYRGNYVDAHNFLTDIMIQKSFLDNKLKMRFYLDDVFNTKRTKSSGTFDPFLLSFYQKKNTRQYTIWLLYTLSSKKSVRSKRTNSSNDARNRL